MPSYEYAQTGAATLPTEPPEPPRQKAVKRSAAAIVAEQAQRPSCPSCATKMAPQPDGSFVCKWCPGQDNKVPPKAPAQPAAATIAAEPAVLVRRPSEVLAEIDRPTARLLSAGPGRKPNPECCGQKTKRIAAGSCICRCSVCGSEHDTHGGVVATKAASAPMSAPTPKTESPFAAGRRGPKARPVLGDGLGEKERAAVQRQLEPGLDGDHATRGEQLARAAEAPARVNNHGPASTSNPRLDRLIETLRQLREAEMKAAAEPFDIAIEQLVRLNNATSTREAPR